MRELLSMNIDSKVSFICTNNIHASQKIQNLNGTRLVTLFFLMTLNYLVNNLLYYCKVYTISDLY